MGGVTDRIGPKPFPWFCMSCAKETVELATVPYTARVKYNGAIREVEIPAFTVPQCRECKTMVFGDDAEKQIDEALLSPSPLPATRAVE